MRGSLENSHSSILSGVSMIKHIYHRVYCMPIVLMRFDRNHFDEFVYRLKFHA